MSITRNFGPVPNFEGIRIGPYDPMSINGVQINSHVAINATGEVAVSEIHSHVSSAAGGILYGAKSRGTASSPTIVNSGDELFGFWGIGHDGTDYAVAAYIKFEVDGTPGSNDMPGRIVFSTSPDGSQTPVERLRISNAGLITVSNGVITSPDTGTNSERFGLSSSAGGDNSVAFGNTAGASEDGAALGKSASAGVQCTAIGSGAAASNASGPGSGSIAIGYGTTAADECVAVGYLASATSGLAFGFGTSVTGANGTAIGRTASVASSGGVAIGSGAAVSTSASGIAIGNSASVGSGSLRTVCIGVSSAASSGADDVICFGTSATSAFSDTIMIGSGATATAANQCMIGGANGSTNVLPITDFVVGRGDSASAPDATVTWRTTNGSGNTISGSALVIRPGLGTGNSTGAYLALSTGPGTAGAASTLQTLVERVRFKAGTEVAFNDGAADYDFRIESVNDPNAFTIDASTDSVSIGVATGSHTGKLHVKQISTTGAKPVITLEQRDLSEEFLRLIGESGTDASQSLVDAVDRPTPGAIAGWFKVYVQDDKASGAITDGVYYVPFYAAPT